MGFSGGAQTRYKKYPCKGSCKRKSYETICENIVSPYQTLVSSLPREAVFRRRPLEAPFMTGRTGSPVNSNPEHARKNCKVLQVVYTQERRIFYYPHGTCFRGLDIEKIFLRWIEYSFSSYMGPNQLRIMDQMAGRLSVRPQESF